VIDAAGAIYVIGGSVLRGGSIGTTYFNDVWVSTDGGVPPDSVRGASGGTLGGYTGGT
jgi:hypothetical protein